MGDLPEHKRNYQAEVHFALGAVIQGITMAALGYELAVALRTLVFVDAVWVFATGLQSLMLCIIFWYSFMNNYFFGFRVVNLNAKLHFFFAAFYLVLGLQQYIAIQFLDSPRLWMTSYVLLIATTLAASWVTSHLPIIEQQKAREVLEYDPYARLLIVCFMLATSILVVWYAFPGIDSALFRIVALSISALGLIVFTLYHILVFQKHLDVR